MASAEDRQLERRFQKIVKPFLASYCVACHGGAQPAAQLDLRAYQDLASVVRDYGHWNQVAERLNSGQMPPKAVKQPPAELRRQILTWISAMRREQAREHAGDPGWVPIRRLSNAEYDYVIRDLTGVNLQPAKDFPVDPANPEGFDNSAESLTMSPALLAKYLQAAREVASHLALTPTGIVFAPHLMLVETDREKFAVQRIVDFYDRQATDYADYFEAAWRYKFRWQLGKPKATLDSTAREARISAKYLPLVWEILGETKDPTIVEVGPIAKLRAMWRELPPPGKIPHQQLRQRCEAMRDFVKRIRKHTAMEFAAPRVKGLSPTSQPLMMWKLRQFATHRREFDRKALRMADDPPPLAPPVPPLAGLGQEAAIRAAAIMARNRAGDPDLVVPAGQRQAYEAAFARFAWVFPDAFYIRERGRFYPDDSEDKGRLLSAGFHNVMGFFRDDAPLMELILDEKEKAELDRLWDEFEFMADFTARTWVQYYFNQSGEVQGRGRESGTERPSDKAVSESAVIFYLRDLYLAKAKADPSNDPVAVQAIEEHFSRIDRTLRTLERRRLEAEPRHRAAVVDFAGRAWRRPLTQHEREQIAGFYDSLRKKNGLTHEEAIRDSIAGILVSPNFCFRMDLGAGWPEAVSVRRPRRALGLGPAVRAEPLSSFALASRLSFFLWSSLPDARLLALAQQDRLQHPAALAHEARRMLKDPRSRALAVEFGGHWLDFRRFEEHNAVDRERFPSFTNELRKAMFEEPVRFLQNLMQEDRSVLDLVYGRHTFVNQVLARHYGMPAPENENTWVRIDEARPFGRGGLLPMAVFLTQNSPGLRTSPVKRGYWVVRRILGERIPPPPPSVPELPADEAKTELPLRAVLAKHRSHPACASCHARFDSFGLAFEGYGPIGERRSRDSAGRPVEARAHFPNGKTGDGWEAVLDYIRQERQQDFIDNFCRKLLAFGLGRSLILSDEPLVEQMKATLAANGHRFGSLIETVVGSPQFRYRRSSPRRQERLADERSSGNGT